MVRKTQDLHSPNFPTRQDLSLGVRILRRNRLQAMYKTMESEIASLNQQVAEQAGNRSGARRLMTHPGVGPVTALATEYSWAIRAFR